MHLAANKMLLKVTNESRVTNEGYINNKERFQDPHSKEVTLQQLLNIINKYPVLHELYMEKDRMKHLENSEEYCLALRKFPGWELVNTSLLFNFGDYLQKPPIAPQPLPEDLVELYNEVNPLKPKVNQFPLAAAHHQPLEIPPEWADDDEGNDGVENGNGSNDNGDEDDDIEFGHPPNVHPEPEIQAQDAQIPEYVARYILHVRERINTKRRELIAYFNRKEPINAKL
jgi:hypothetical protein